MQPQTMNETAVEEAVRLFESHAGFARAQVRMRDRMEEGEKNLTAGERTFFHKDRMEYLIGRLDVRAETFLELVSDIQTQNAFITILWYSDREVWREFTGNNGDPHEVIRPASAEAQSLWESVHARVQRWIDKGYRHLAHQQPEEVLTEESPPVTGPNFGKNGPARRAAVDAYLEEVFKKTNKRIIRKDFWMAASYKARTEFERWERDDPKYPNQSADKAFTRVLTQKPHLK
jgi:hypothetical protein